MSWFNGRDFSDAVAQGVRKGLQPTFLETAANAFATAGRRRAEMDYEKSMVLQAQFAQKLKWVHDGTENPEILFDTPFHITVAKFSVLRHPDIYKNVDLNYWVEQVLSFDPPRKEKDLPSALLNAVNNINNAFAEAGYDIDQLMDEREKWVEFDEEYNELFAKEQELKAKFGRIFSPKFATVDDLIDGLSKVFEVRIRDDVKLTKPQKQYRKERELEFFELVVQCPKHESEISYDCTLLIDFEISLAKFKLYQRMPGTEGSFKIADDGWSLTVHRTYSDCDCNYQGSLVDMVIEAIGGEITFEWATEESD